MNDLQRVEGKSDGAQKRVPISPVVHDRVLGLIEKYVEKPAEILDLGAGEGEFSRRLNEAGYRAKPVDGFDIYWRNPQIPLIIADLDTEFAEKISPDGQKYDAIAAIEIIEHIENPFSFIRQCAKLLKPGGLLFVTSPNVESITSRVLFLYTGRIAAFEDGWTIRTAHITPLFKWKFDLAFAETGFEYVWEGYNRISYHIGDRLHNKIAGLAARLLRPFVKGEKDGENRIIVARLSKNLPAAK